MQKILLACYIICFALSVSAERRTVSVKLNPFCDERCNELINDSSLNLVWIKLEGKNDTIHYLYSTIESFTIMVFRTNVTSSLEVDWDEYLTKNKSYNSIKFKPAPFEYAGYSIPYIYEFNDLNGVANMSEISNNESYWRIYETSNFIWSKFRPITNESGLFEAKISNNHMGVFRFIVKYPGLEKRDADLPHLLLSSESNLIDFIIDSIRPSFEYSKFGINFVLFNPKQMSASLKNKQTLDDEYTPGTFNLWNVEISELNSSKVNNFIEWKPIFYYDDPRILENSTLTFQYELRTNQTIPNGLACVFSKEQTLGYGFNVSFGLSGDIKDGYFYPQTNYSAWSFSVGFSRAPLDKMSSIVSLVIAIGFGVPAFVVLVGLFGLCAKKLKRNQYSQI